MAELSLEKVQTKPFLQLVGPGLGKFLNETRNKTGVRRDGSDPKKSKCKSHLNQHSGVRRKCLCGAREAAGGSGWMPELHPRREVWQIPTTRQCRAFLIGKERGMWINKQC